jgi:elongation factor 3
LEEFVTAYPEKQGYFELKNDVVKFSFLVPGNLEGVKSRSKALVKLSNVSFQYPSRTAPTIMGVNLMASRVSRVAVIGANGAGKSTAIKILIGELKATSGDVYRHPNLRLAYVAQHAFQHLEKHLTQTPTQYILERFAGNDDKENIDFKAKAASEEVKDKKKYFINPATNSLKVCEATKEEDTALNVEAVIARRENKKEKTKEYQCKLQHKAVEDAIWIPRDIMIKMGHLTLCQRQDEKEAMAAGLASKMLTSEGVEKHLNNFGLDAETASHTTIQSLSGGQKVKVVLGASMWQDPHIVILDEPTNYLDRDGLGALTLAIHDFQGGVIIISHNKEFCNAVASEKWIMKAGLLKQEGESVDKMADSKDDGGNKEEEEVRDAAGNIIDMKKEIKLSDKDKKKEIKDLEKKMKDAKKKAGLYSEDEIYEMEDRLNLLKEELAAMKA